MNVNLGHYDFNRKTFSLNGALAAGNQWWVSDNPQYRYTFTNGDRYGQLGVSDEAKAREIESRASKREPMRLDVYAYAQDADPNQLALKSEIMSARLIDRQGRELYRQ